jgi:RNA polymerase sigma-70 factor (ECF subfamily)
MEACRPYLMTVASREIASGLLNKAGASDLVQETFLEAQRDLLQFQGRSEEELRRWLRAILRNNLAGFVRRYRATYKRQASREVSIERDDAAGALKDALASPAPSPSGVAIRREEDAQLLRALGRLKERDRLVILWRSQEHCPWDEVGRRLGGTAGMAQKVWSRAVHKLREALAAPADPAADPPPPD